jgi:hypothetical protein
LNLVITSTQRAFAWEDRWYTSTGVGTVEFTADVRNTALGPNPSAMEIKPALQFAPVRTDRPDAGVAITAGQAITGDTTTNGPVHFEETVSAAAKFWFRRGWSYKLTAGTFARCETLLYTSFLSCGTVFPAKEVVFNPLNDKADVSLFPLTGPFAAVGVDIAKMAVIGLDNVNTDLEYRAFGRAFNDLMARGAWTALESVWANPPQAGDFFRNTGEIALTDLALGTKHWMELALGVRKGADGEPNSRVIFHVIPAVKYA